MRRMQGHGAISGPSGCAPHTSIDVSRDRGPALKVGAPASGAFLARERKSRHNSVPSPPDHAPTMNASRSIAMLLACLFAGAAQAHPGHGDASFLTGLLHPVTGLDHVLAMLAVGLWAGLRDRVAGPASVLLLPGLFVASAAVGTALGLAGLFNASIETAVAASLLPMGMALICGVRSRHLIALTLVPLCGVFHGGAHGAELAGLASTGAVAGFLLGTALLHAAGVAVCLALPSTRRRLAVAGYGGGLAAASLWLLA